MSHRPKPVRNHYIESLAVNSENLNRQLSAESVSIEEIQKLLESISNIYLAETERIVLECQKDTMALERAPSPLSLFVGSIARVLSSGTVSHAASGLMKRYVSAWEEWM